MKLKCEHCGRKWDYHGGMKVYAPCPDCRRGVRI